MNPTDCPNEKRMFPQGSILFLFAAIPSLFTRAEMPDSNAFCGQHGTKKYQAERNLSPGIGILDLRQYTASPFRSECSPQRSSEGSGLLRSADNRNDGYQFKSRPEGRLFVCLLFHNSGVCRILLYGSNAVQAA